MSRQRVVSRQEVTLIALVVIISTVAYLLLSRSPSNESSPRVLGHPRLHFTAAELTALQGANGDKFRTDILANVMQSADWCLTRPLRSEWIPPVEPDPIYANLYDRFYAMMHDMAVMEHLAFAWSIGRDERHGNAAVDWALACSNVWRKEADEQPDGSKAYAVMRLIKGLAVSYDLLYDRFSESEREKIRSTITDISQAYYEGYFNTPNIAGPNFHKHHATVEYASFGVAALAVLHEDPRAEQWLQATITKFRNHLLPMGLAQDGAQVEGATFWASTMQYRLAFMDALYRVTGENLFTPFAAMMDAKLALASVAALKEESFDQDHQTVVHSPSYGQINYYAPVLLALARFYRNPLYQHLALWDLTAGSVQQTRYITKNNEWLLFGWGAYAFAWYDETVPAKIDSAAPLSFSFPSVDEAYLRSSYEPNGVVAGMRRSAVVVHAGGRPVYVDLRNARQPYGQVRDIALQDDGRQATLTCQGDADSGFLRQTLHLDRPAHLTLTRDTDTEQAWWYYGNPVQQGNTLRWEDGTILMVKTGTIISVDPQGYKDEKVVGLGKLSLKDPRPMSYTLVRVQPQGNRLEIKVTKE
jgi:hypothetical protein